MDIFNNYTNHYYYRRGEWIAKKVFSFLPAHRYRSVFFLLTLILICFTCANGQDGGRVYTGKPASAPPDPINKPKNNPKAVGKPAPKPTDPTPVNLIPKSLIPQLAQIPAGSFLMGAMAQRPNEAPVHKVQLDSFEIGVYEVSNQEFEAFTNATNYKTEAERVDGSLTWRNYYVDGRGNYPVVLVSWNDAAMYCKWLSEATGENFRLPTEAEWEYAARGGLTGKVYPWGDDIDDDRANFDSEGSRTNYSGVALDFLQPVDSYSANGFGLFNVAGNVWEWCQDWYNEHYYSESPASSPKGPVTGNFKVLRGGGWINDGNSCRVSYRNFNGVSFKMAYLGFRVVKAAR